MGATMNYTRIALMTILSTTPFRQTPQANPIRILDGYEIGSNGPGIVATVSCYVVEAGMLPTLFKKLQTGFTESIRLPIPETWRP